MKLEDMQQRLKDADESLTEQGLDAVRGVLRDLLEVVEALVQREAKQVPLPLTQEPFSVWPTPGPNRMQRIASPRWPELKDLSDDELRRFLPRGRPHLPIQLHYIRRDFEFYQPHPKEQPALFSIRRRRPQR